MNDLPRGDGDEALTQALLQPGCGGFACAMPGVEAGGQGKQVRSRFVDAFCTGFGKVEASDEDIGTEVGGDVEDAAVGTAADENAFSCFLDEQVLFVAEDIGGMLSFKDGAHAISCGGVGAGEKCGRVQGDAGGYGVCSGRDGAEARVAGQRGGQPDVFARGIEMRLEGMRVHPDGGMGVELQKAGDAAAVVIVPVGEDGHVHRAQVDAQLRRIVGKGGGGPGVEKNAMPSGLNQEAEPVLGTEVGSATGVFDEDGDAHADQGVSCQLCSPWYIIWRVMPPSMQMFSPVMKPAALEQR